MANFPSIYCRHIHHVKSNFFLMEKDLAIIEKKFNVYKNKNIDSIRHKI